MKISWARTVIFAQGYVIAHESATVQKLLGIGPKYASYSKTHRKQGESPFGAHMELQAVALPARVGTQ